MISTDASNPFRTSRTRPGQIAFFFRDQESWGTLLRRFRLAKNRGQIVGPHGSGKSTLLVQFAGYLEGVGQPARLLRISPRRKLDLDELNEDRRLVPGTVLALDGYEQLGLGIRLRLGQLVARRALGLLVTTHRATTWLPILHRTAVNLQVAHHVVQQLLTDRDSRLHGQALEHLAEERLLEQLLARHRGNLREILFELFDLWRAGK